MEASQVSDQHPVDPARPVETPPVEPQPQVPPIEEPQAEPTDPPDAIIGTVPMTQEDHDRLAGGN